MNRALANRFGRVVVAAGLGQEPSVHRKGEGEMRSFNVLGRTSPARAAAIVTASLMLLLLGGIQVVRADHLPVHGTILARGPFTEELDLKVKARIGGDLELVQVD